MSSMSFGKIQICLSRFQECHTNRQLKCLSHNLSSFFGSIAPKLYYCSSLRRKGWSWSIINSFADLHLEICWVLAESTPHIVFDSWTNSSFKNLLNSNYVIPMQNSFLGVYDQEVEHILYRNVFIMWFLWLMGHCDIFPVPWQLSATYIIYICGIIEPCLKTQPCSIWTKWADPRPADTIW